MVAIFGDSYIEALSQLQSKAVTVMDAHTGFVLYQNAQHDLMYPASVTKVMTALLVLEEIEDLQQELVFSEHSVMSLPTYASRVNMMAGDTITIYEALYGLMLPSGNDVANALAEHISGNIHSFVAQMNLRAAELGAVNTHFVNPCGLPGDGQYITAYDLALIMREAITHPVFNEIIASPNFFISPTESFPEGLTVRNTNLLIQPEASYHNVWVLGGKTGFTNAAQHTLVSRASQGNHDLIVSVLYAPRGATFTDTTYLLNHAFSLPIETIFESANYSWEIPVIQNIDGELIEIGIATVQGRNDLLLPITENTSIIRYGLYIPDSLTPPVRMGDVIGYKTFYANETLLSNVELIATHTILPRMMITPRSRQESAYTETLYQSAPVSLPLPILLPIVTIMLMGMILISLRRQRIKQRRIMMRRQRRREARIRYARYRFSE